MRDYVPCVRACYHASVIQSITIDCFAQEQVQTSPDCTRPPQTKQDASGLLQQYNRHSLALQNTADQPQQSGKYSIGGLEIGRRATRIRSGVFRGALQLPPPLQISSSTSRFSGDRSKYVRRGVVGGRGQVGAWAPGVDGYVPLQKEMMVHDKRREGNMECHAPAGDRHLLPHTLATASQGAAGPPRKGCAAHGEHHEL